MTLTTECDCVDANQAIVDQNPNKISKLNLQDDVVQLTKQICDIESVSGNEELLADLIEAALRDCSHLEVLRSGNTVLARTNFGHKSRILIAGHIDTVPLGQNVASDTGEPNFPTHFSADGKTIHGRGTVDMKGGVAVQLSLAAKLTKPKHDLTWIFYDCEEVEAARNGLLRIMKEHREWLNGDFAVVCEPTSGLIEGGCNGTIRVEVVVPGKTAHTARAWRGDNAIHKAHKLLQKLTEYECQTIKVDGLNYREGLNAVLINGGVATNVVPDECVITVNHRFAPNKSPEDAEKFMRDFFEGYEVRLIDLSPGARPGLNNATAQELIAITQQPAKPKYGWTDVARFSELGMGAVNFGPGNPSLAHTDEEYCPVDEIRYVADTLFDWLS